MSKGARIRASVPHRRAKIMEKRDNKRALWFLKKKIQEREAASAEA